MSHGINVLQAKEQGKAEMEELLTKLQKVFQIIYQCNRALC